MNINYITISNALREYRKEMGLTQAEFAERINRSPKTIAQWEQCKAEPPIDVLIIIRNQLGISLDDIYGLQPLEEVIPDDKLIKKWATEYYNDESLIRKMEFDEPHSPFKKNDLKGILEFDMYTFLEETSELLCFDLFNKRITLRTNHGVDSSIIDFFMRKGLISYFSTYDEEKDLIINDNYCISPLLSKILIKQHIKYLQNCFDTIGNAINGAINIEQMQEFIKKKKSDCADGIKADEAKLKDIEKMEKNDE